MIATEEPKLISADPHLLLREGDQLNAAEFHRRYLRMPDVHGAELIEGMVYMPSPVRTDKHGDQVLAITRWALRYEEATSGIHCGSGVTVRMNKKNEPQPDFLIRILSECGGQSYVNLRGFTCGSPELFVEVSASTFYKDTRTKFRTYRRLGVQEYIIWQVEREVIEWWRLRNGEYVKLPEDVLGIIRSEVFPGLWLDVSAMLKFDWPKVYAMLDRGIASPEHEAFAAELQARRKSEGV